jgi:hypothetical protein
MNDLKFFLWRELEFSSKSGLSKSMLDAMFEIEVIPPDIPGGEYRLRRGKDKEALKEGGEMKDDES